ncbi:hypothetical protein OSB04_008380 [Centaurea solstitialis]|uniref:Gnk2-homologous domain-containing protein n=1 Tax=Centaurea solstitialis TaxID=347529 RepID=A0AA38TLN6_9ASTR|nr:hypothetical protein OSB04_008380 [Centaurea solstitialis]
MLIFAGKLLLYIIYTTTTTIAQPKFISHYCEKAANYTVNSTYQRNLDTNLATLPTTNSGFGFYNLSTGQANDTVNSVALCRGDVEPDSCRSCLNDSIVNLRQLCPIQKEAIGYYDTCLLKYSNVEILGTTGIKFYVFFPGSETTTDVDRFYGDLRPLMDGLRGNASSGGPLRKFASGSTDGPRFTTIYALVQCTPDLSDRQCSDCLENAANEFANRYSGSVRGRTLVPMCNFRYDTNRFFSERNSVIPPPPTIQLPPPPLSPPPLPGCS